ncbi:hypothetical protein KB206_00355 [Microvirga sp. STS02]|uniref:hypothetical protein n=1 Tax=Hymenobacter negativus TaxID=2795026 RepID=UPI0018DD9684|nr:MULTISPECIES: hypothetical protein [Bacteria]MBH8567316.1 hypothetical protein [Hymenobacter negativus]MBR7207048.1 hypothetical protein [Microvirga sp. STS02]
MLRKLPLHLALLLLTQCSKCKNDPRPADPVSQLPPVTQTGANTFGCLVNGQAYTPQGNNGTSNFAVLYEPGPTGANLNLLTYRITSNGRQYLNLSCGPVTQARTYSLSIPVTEGTAGYADTSRPRPCDSYESNQAPSYRKGTLTLTRLDLQARIIAGTFELTLAQPGCDTIRITQGRFDKKL